MLTNETIPDFKKRGGPPLPSWAVHDSAALLRAASVTFERFDRCLAMMANKARQWQRDVIDGRFDELPFSAADRDRLYPRCWEAPAFVENLDCVRRLTGDGWIASAKSTLAAEMERVGRKPKPQRAAAAVLNRQLIETGAFGIAIKRYLASTLDDFAPHARQCVLGISSTADSSGPAEPGSSHSPRAK